MKDSAPGWQDQLSLSLRLRISLILPISPIYRCRYCDIADFTNFSLPILLFFSNFSLPHHLLPSPVGQLACAIHATLDVYGQDVDFIVSHNGQEENPLD